MYRPCNAVLMKQRTPLTKQKAKLKRKTSEPTTDNFGVIHISHLKPTWSQDAPWHFLIYHAVRIVIPYYRSLLRQTWHFSGYWVRTPKKRNHEIKLVDVCNWPAANRALKPFELNILSERNVTVIVWALDANLIGSCLPQYLPRLSASWPVPENTWT